MNLNNYVIFTDVTSDLPADICKKNGIRILNMNFSVDDKEYHSLDEMSITEFYKKMREGSTTKTSQVTMETGEICFKEVLDAGFDILCICFSSALSGTYNAMRMTAESLAEQYPNRKIRVVDSLSASLGEGLLVVTAAAKKAEGLTVDELHDWIVENRLSFVHLFTVDDLMFLHRGGRVSKTSAIAGSILGIKPVLHVDNEGRLIPTGKVRGRKAALNALIDKMGEQLGGMDNPMFAISHGDSIEDAMYIVNEVKRRYGIKEYIINHVGTVVGAHSGPGTIALFFRGIKR